MNWRTDRPDEYQHVLICLFNPDEAYPRIKICIAWLNKARDWMTPSGMQIHPRRVITHWMPLPSAPDFTVEQLNTINQREEAHNERC